MYFSKALLTALFAGSAIAAPKSKSDAVKDVSSTSTAVSFSLFTDGVPSTVTTTTTVKGGKGGQTTTVTEVRLNSTPYVVFSYLLTYSQTADPITTTITTGKKTVTIVESLHHFSSFFDTDAL